MRGEVSIKVGRSRWQEQVGLVVAENRLLLLHPALHPALHPVLLHPAQTQGADKRRTFQTEEAIDTIWSAA